jgi:hypothetical protein
VLCSSSSEQGAYVGVTAAGEGLTVSVLQWSFTVHDSTATAATTAAATADVDSSDVDTSTAGAQVTFILVNFYSSNESYRSK